MPAGTACTCLKAAPGRGRSKTTAKDQAVASTLGAGHDMQQRGAAGAVSRARAGQGDHLPRPTKDMIALQEGRQQPWWGGRGNTAAQAAALPRKSAGRCSSQRTPTFNTAVPARNACCPLLPPSPAQLPQRLPAPSNIHSGMLCLWKAKAATSTTAARQCLACPRQALCSAHPAHVVATHPPCPATQLTSSSCPARVPPALPR